MTLTKIAANGRLLFACFLLVVFVAALRSTRDAAAQGQTPPSGASTCPGEPMTIQATGVYTQKPVEQIVINGKPAPGAIWSPGMRSYWHCHTGGQIMMLFDGVGRVQQRGERMRVLRKGDTEYAGPGVEHWHGAAPDSPAQVFQTTIGVTTTLWMEEVGNDDYMGNDTGINSRNEFLKTGVRKKYESVEHALKTAQSPKR
jgi:hypothetical protein